MLTLSISTGTASTLTVNDTGTSGYVMTRSGWNNGAVVNESTYAESRWVDGAAITSTRKTVVSMNLQVRAYGTSIADLQNKVTALGSALSQYSYTVTEVYSGGSAVHNCMPAASINMDYDPDLLRLNMAVISATIPRQP